MTGATVLLLGCASSTPHGRDQMRRASAQLRRRGIRLVGADAGPLLASVGLSAGVQADSPVDEVVELEVQDADACRTWAEGRQGIDAVFTFREMCVEPVAAVAAQLGLPGIPPAVARTIRTKDLCRAALVAAGFSQPECTVAADMAEAERFLATTRGPWIVKPRSGMGSVGVGLVDGVEGLPAAAEAAGGAPFLVETYVAGPEFSAEGLVRAGRPEVLALTAKRTGAGFVETGHRIPAPLGPDLAARARRHVEAALISLGVTAGAFHVEFWLQDDAVVLGEVHARPGGDFLHAMLEHVRPGLELYGALVDDLLGKPPAPLPSAAGAAGAEFLLLPPGTVTALEGWDAVLAEPSVLAADLAVAPGDQLGGVAGSADRHGVVAVGGDTSEAVEATLRRLLGGVHVQVRDPEPK